MRKRNPPRPAEVSITSLSKKGNGIGVVEGETERFVEVPFSMPGDKLRILMHRKRSGVYGSSLEEILTPSPDRVEARCVHFAMCGGCRWQHIPYAKQLEIKQELITKLFLPHIVPGLSIDSIIPCDPPWEYRNKMEFTFSSDAAGKHYLGLIIDGSRGKVLNLTECHLTHPWFIDALKATRQWWGETNLAAYHPHSNKGSLRTLTVRESLRTGDRLIMLTVSGNADYALQKQHLESLTAFLRDAAEPLTPGSQLSIFLRIQQIAKGTATNFYEILLYGPDHIDERLTIKPAANEEATSLTFAVSPSAFFQPNTRQAEKLYSRALQLLDIRKGCVVYDLYCGTGTLGICVAQHAKQVIGIEISPESSLDARTNAAANGLKNVTILTGSVRDVITRIRQEQSHLLPDIVMVDPPRIGLDEETIKHLIDLNPEKILYISCNPTTQAENIVALKAAGYQITAIQPVDQFPHTVHIENIVVLKRNVVC
ncbi:MAG: 23S rRNA (uracil(1939)-C(5))-methyltransferase RlmD [Parachlamydiaceae bacterium]|nr:23S rRNA (uracil(1939)-C(5))-methyltransferase RlmD [Parachlamydiaceae bacterium]